MGGGARGRDVNLKNFLKRQVFFVLKKEIKKLSNDRPKAFHLQNVVTPQILFNRR